MGKLLGFGSPTVGLLATSCFSFDASKLTFSDNFADEAPVPLLIRAASLAGFAELAQTLGLDSKALLAAHGLNADMLADPDLRVPLRAVTGVLEQASHQAACGDLGLRLAARRDISNLGATGMLMLCQPTLRDAWHGVIARRQSLNDGLLLRLEEAHGVAVLSFDLVRENRHQGLRQSLELIMGVQVRLMRLFLGPDWAPRRVLFCHPPALDTRLHARLLGPCVEFDSAFNGMVLSSRDLDQPMACADPALAGWLGQQLALSQRGGRLADRVRQLLWLMLPRGDVAIDHVAAHLGLQRRTLQRRLNAEGQSYQALLQDLRREVAQAHVLHTGRRLSDVALLLGFSCASAFSRWHVAQFGVTAEAARRAFVRGRR